MTVNIIYCTAGSLHIPHCVSVFIFYSVVKYLFRSTLFPEYEILLEFPELVEIMTELIRNFSHVGKLRMESIF